MDLRFSQSFLKQRTVRLIEQSLYFFWCDCQADMLIRIIVGKEIWEGDKTKIKSVVLRIFIQDGGSVIKRDRIEKTLKNTENERLFRNLSGLYKLRTIEFSFHFNTTVW